jgi:hypothetical protein
MKSLLSLIIIFIAYQISFACSCDISFPQLPTSEILKDIGIIFQGKVISVGPSLHSRLKNSKGKYYDAIPTYKTEFEVIRKWKGIKNERITIETETLSCGTQFQVNKEYLILANSENQFETGFCQRKLISLNDVETEYGIGETIKSNSTSESFWSTIWNKITSIFS